MAKRASVIKKIIWSLLGVIVLFVIILTVSIVVLIKNETKVTQGQPIKSYNKDNCALLIIDIQEVITGEGSIYPALYEQSEKLIGTINRAIDSFETNNYPVVYVRSEITSPFINLLNNTYAKGSPRVKFDKRLKVVSPLEVVKTGQDSFRKTGLDEILEELEVNRLYIAGVNAAECVNTTVQAAFNRQYRVNIIKGAVIAKQKSTTDSMMACFADRGAGMVTADNLQLPGN